MAQCSPRPGGYAHALRSADPLVSFLYTLMRDHLPPGVVEGLVVDASTIGHGNMAAFSNDFLAAYATELTLRLQPGRHEGKDEQALAEAHRRLRHAQDVGHAPSDE